MRLRYQTLNQSGVWGDRKKEILCQALENREWEQYNEKYAAAYPVACWGVVGRLIYKRGSDRGKESTMLRNSVNYIYQVYKEKSFSKAAQKLFVSQPALSAAIQKEEAVWGCAFFDRSTNPIELTPEGREFITAIERMREIQQELEDSFARCIQARQHTVNIGAPTFFCAYILPPILQDFQRGHPHCQINVIEASDNDLIECLQKDTIDACLTVQTWSGHMFQTTAIGEEDIILAVPAAAPMNKRLSEYQLGPDDLKSASRLRDDCPRLSIGEFKELPFLLLKQGNDMYSRGMKICKQGGFAPNTFVTLDQLLTSYHMAAAGTGAAFIRAGLMRYASGGVCFYGLDSKDTVRSIHLVCKKNRALPDTVQNFLSYLSHACNK